MSTMLEASSQRRVDQLKELRDKLASAIDECASMRDLAALSRQYRETIREIEEIEGTIEETDEIKKLLDKRVEDGKANPVRKNRTEI